VDVAELFQRKQICSVVGVVELIGCRLVNRHGNRTRRRICAPAGMECLCFRVKFLFRHNVPPFGILRSWRAEASPRSQQHAQYVTGFGATTFQDGEWKRNEITSSRTFVGVLGKRYLLKS